MIDKEYGTYTLSCDICGCEVKNMDDFYEAVDYKKENGWKSQRHSDWKSEKHRMDWEDICPDCVGGTP